MIGGLDAQPWRMDAGSYLASVRADGLPLNGSTVEPIWSVELGAAMRETGVAVHEEAVLDALLSDADQLV